MAIQVFPGNTINFTVRWQHSKPVLAAIDLRPRLEWVDAYGYGFTEETYGGRVRSRVAGPLVWQTETLPVVVGDWYEGDIAYQIGFRVVTEWTTPEGYSAETWLAPVVQAFMIEAAYPEDVTVEVVTITVT